MRYVVTQARGPKLGGRPMTQIRRRVEKDKIENKQLELKTSEMMRLEIHYGRSIQRLLMEGSGVEVATKLRVTESCISRWRSRFGLTVTYGGHV